MRRRQLLALSGSLLAGTAGCLSASAPEASGPASTRDSPTTDPTTDTTATTDTESTADRHDTTTTTQYADVSVELDALQPGLVTMTSPDSIGVSARDQRYLLVEVSTGESGRAPPREAFSFEVGGTSYRPQPLDPPWRIWRFSDDEGALYDRESGGGLLLFELPEDASSDSGDVSSDFGDASSDSGDADPVLTWPGGEWQPDESIARRLVRPEPPLSVTLDVPETVEPTASPTVSVTVENGGDVPGRFVAGLNRIGPMVAYAPVERVSMLVPAGESETWEFTDDSAAAGDYPDERVGDGDSDVTYHLDWAGGSVRRGVRYAE